MKEISLANDQTAFFPEFRGDGAHGQIFAANDANFDQQHMSEPLTEYIVAYPDEEGLSELLDAAAPAIPVSRAFTYRTHSDVEAFQAALNDEDIREIGGDFAMIRRTGSQVDGRTDNKGLIMVLDNDQGGEDSAVQQRAVANLRGRLLRTELRRLVTLLDANDTAASSKNWGPAATNPQPDGDILEQVDLSGDARGIDANTVLYGGGSWVKRKRSLLGSNSPGGYSGFASTPDVVAGMLGVDRALISKFRYQSNATTKTKVLADDIYIYYAKQGLMAEDPSNIKRFVTMTPAGRWRVYIEPKLKKTLVCLEHYSRLICTSTLGIRKQPVTFT